MPVTVLEMINVHFRPSFFIANIHKIVPGSSSADDTMTFLKMSPSLSPMYWATPKKHMPQTNQLKHMQIVFDRKFGVRNKSRKLPRAASLVFVFVLIAYFSKSILIDSVGRLLNAATFSSTAADSSMRPMVKSQRGLSGIIQ